MNLEIFDKTEELSSKLLKLIDLPLFDDSERHLVSYAACSISMEHWEATLHLLNKGFLSSSVVVHRAQFEALLRSVWALYAASDLHLKKLSALLTLETEQNAKNMPQTADMLDSIGKKGPPQVFDALTRFKDNSWKALNSYAHAGIHPMQRHSKGYPPQLLESVVSNSNGLAIVSAMQIAILSGQQSLQSEILNLASNYPDCMPPAL